jgi:hypothetical protein
MHARIHDGPRLVVVGSLAVICGCGSRTALLAEGNDDVRAPGDGALSAAVALDAGTTLDTGATLEAGTLLDTATTLDAGTIIDTSTPLEAGTEPAAPSQTECASQPTIDSCIDAGCGACINLTLAVLARTGAGRDACYPRPGARP